MLATQNRLSSNDLTKAADWAICNASRAATGPAQKLVWRTDQGDAGRSPRKQATASQVDTLQQAGFNPNLIVLLPQWNHPAGH